MDELGLTVLNEPASHTRIGQGVCRDTSPDLSVWSGVDAVTWSNPFEDLGSDHRILCVTVGENESEEDVCREARIVDWDRFRKNRERDKKEGPIEDISEWCRELLADVEKATGARWGTNYLLVISTPIEKCGILSFFNNATNRYDCEMYAWNETVQTELHECKECYRLYCSQQNEDHTVYNNECTEDPGC
ncbi:hypothetical protein HPB49_009851 [Dermacentor silvarum]|uniref:Uncharacterized protein n=1 Tax=Dermacentor silvarum TaxID=543639 RepID=A0ACB8C8U1_DERSI|nr:hypothetical protein HPB49_009851 [Dermacentor silvarum]